MFDFSLGEFGLIAVVALVVLGPDKLPKVAKTAGEWMGRAQRFVTQVKSDIDKEVELSELKQIQEDARKMAEGLQSDLKGAKDVFEKNISEADKSVKSLTSDLEKTLKDTTATKDNWIKQAEAKPGESSPTVAETEVVDTDEWGAPVDTLDTTELDDAYSWGTSANTWERKTFSKRYLSGPSIDDMALEIEKLRAEIGHQSGLMTDRRINKYARGARINKPRIRR